MREEQATEHPLPHLITRRSRVRIPPPLLRERPVKAGFSCSSADVAAGPGGSPTGPIFAGQSPPPWYLRKAPGSGLEPARRAAADGRATEMLFRNQALPARPIEVEQDR